MAQKIDALQFRLGYNTVWLSQWYSKKHYSTLFFEDCLIRTYLQRTFDLRGFLTKRCLIQRKGNQVLIFLEFLASSFIPYQVPRKHRAKGKLFHKVLFLQSIHRFLRKLAGKSVYISFKNVFVINRIHRRYVYRLRGLFSRFRRFKFSLNILSVFNILIRSRCAFFLAKTMANELTIVNFKKRDPKIWKFIRFSRQLVEYIRNQETALHGIRIHLKGRFKGMRRSKLKRYLEGAVPFNTIRAHIDYSAQKSITVNGSFGLHVWVAYKSGPQG